MMSVLVKSPDSILLNYFCIIHAISVQFNVEFITPFTYFNFDIEIVDLLFLL